MALVALVIVAAPAWADGHQDRIASLSTRLMSPFCPGLTIHDCPTREAEELRSQMIEWAEKGWSNERIVERLRSQYGPSIEAIPRDGTAFLVWAIPGLALLAGIAIAYFVARRWTKEGPEAERSRAGRGPEAGPTDADPTPRWDSSTSSERRRLQAELDSMKNGDWGPA